MFCIFVTAFKQFIETKNETFMTIKFLEVV